MKNIFQSAKVVVLALILSFGISYVSAWTAPTATPPSGNTSAPINVGGTAQTKSGALNIIRNPISSDAELGSYGVSGASSGVGYVTIGRGGSNNGGFLGWDYTNSGIALNAHSAGGSVGGLFVKRADNAHSNVGIGTINPGNAFDVVGSSYFSGTVNAQDVYSRDAGKWMSQLGGGVTSVNGQTGAVTIPAGDRRNPFIQWANTTQSCSIYTRGSYYATEHRATFNSAGKLSNICVKWLGVGMEDCATNDQYFFTCYDSFDGGSSWCRSASGGGGYNSYTQVSVDSYGQPHLYGNGGGVNAGACEVVGS